MKYREYQYDGLDLSTVDGFESYFGAVYAHMLALLFPLIHKHMTVLWVNRLSAKNWNFGGRKFRVMAHNQ
jgi:hypothetical protein